MSLNPKDVVIVDYARTPMGRSKDGCFRNKPSKRSPIQLKKVTCT